ncbi:MAG TPA: hypothetical protein VF669_23650 [Tepidisphaeraceae bacterium]|jgi:hypothetical protein
MPEKNAGESVGRLRVDISDALLCTVVDVLVASWPAVVSSKVVTATSTEDEITDVLYEEMYDEKERRELDNIDFDREPQSNLRHEPLPLGYIDVKVSYNAWRKTDYFAIECKKVSASSITPAKKYIDDGVVRFVTEKYSSGHSRGAMVGYVVDGCEEDCARLLEGLFSSHKLVETNIRRAWSRHDLFRSHPHVFRSDHEQQHSKRIISLMHVLLSFSMRSL